jgi:hypothetical protein
MAIERVVLLEEDVDGRNVYDLLVATNKLQEKFERYKAFLKKHKTWIDKAVQEEAFISYVNRYDLQNVLDTKDPCEGLSIWVARNEIAEEIVERIRKFGSPDSVRVIPDENQWVIHKDGMVIVVEASIV